MRTESKLFLLATLVLLSSVAGSLDVRATGPVQICGMVLGKNLQGDLRPIGFANVTAVAGIAKITQPTFDGSYCMFLLPGTYSLTAASPGYISKTIQVAVTGGELNGIDFNLDPSGAPIPEFPLVPLPLLAALALFIVVTRLRRRTL